MVNEELGINGRNDPTRIFRIKEAAKELCVFDTTDWRYVHDSFCIVTNEANGVDTAYQNISVKVIIWQRSCASYSKMLLQPPDRQQGGNS